MKKKLSAAAATALIVLSFGWPGWLVEGPTADKLLSLIVRANLRSRMRFEGTSFRRFPAVSFTHASSGRAGNECLAAGSGVLIFSNRHARFTVRALRVQKDCPEAPAFLRTLAGFSGGTLDADALDVAVNLRSGHLRILRFSSEKALVKGGAQWREGRLFKAHGRVWIPAQALKSVPSILYAGMGAPRDGRMSFRVFFGSNLLTLSGPSGPFFKASWQPS